MSAPDISETLITRLETTEWSEWPKEEGKADPINPDGPEAATAIRALQGRFAELEEQARLDGEALRPFAEESNAWPEDVLQGGARCAIGPSEGWGYWSAFTFSDLAAARARLAAREGGAG